MKATCTLTKKTALETLIESGDLNAINEMIEQKETALLNALKNVEYYKGTNNIEFANEEQARADRLTKHLNILIPVYLKKRI